VNGITIGPKRLRDLQRPSSAFQLHIACPSFNLKVVDFAQPDVHMLLGAASLAMVTAAWGLAGR
jgi:hypothetical protein